MNATAAVALSLLAIFWFFLLFLTFRPPDTPKPSRLLFFVLWLMASAIIGFYFLISVYEWDPNPARVDLARSLTDDKMIYLGDIVPGLYNLDYIDRIDTDLAQETEPREWVAFYQYDVKEDPERETYAGPYGAGIYDYDECRPPAILSYELVPANYNYLGQDEATIVVENIIPWQDPLSANQDRPEVIVNGFSRGVVTDLNVFRKEGVELSCLQRQQWQVAHPGEAFPNPVRYANVGSFRGNYQIERGGSTITTVDSAGFERSQFVVRRQYRPENGSYFQPHSQVLLDPVEYSLGFGPGEPDEITQVYYPEKAVLAFYLSLGKDDKKLSRAESYLSPWAQDTYNIKSDPFGLATADDSVARARDKLARVLVWEIRYEPDAGAEQLHKDRQIRVTVVGVNEGGEIDYAHPCQVTWVVIGEPKAGAQPYGCEWRLDHYQTSCVSADLERKEEGVSLWPDPALP